MGPESLRSFLGWCVVLDYAFLLLWFVAFVLFHDAIYELHRRWFALTEERFDAIHYAGMAAFKILVFVSALVPWLALHAVG